MARVLMKKQHQWQRDQHFADSYLLPGPPTQQKLPMPVSVPACVSRILFQGPLAQGVGYRTTPTVTFT
jgi:hypothetical protein